LLEVYGGLRGTPRYLKGKLPSLKPVSWRINRFKLSLTPPKYIDYFAAFIVNPEVCPKINNC
jgi:hypothetical protein